MKRALATILLVLGCKAGPDYVRPAEVEAKLPASYTVDADLGVLPGEAEITTWWRIFGDDELTRLIETAQLQNIDLKVAMARVEAARHRVRQVEAQKYPQLGLGGMAGAAGGQFTDGDPTGVWSVGLNASWEVATWGRIARSIEAMEASYEMSVEDRRNVLVWLNAEVARNYILVRSAQLRLATTLKNIESQTSIRDITQSRFDAGISSRLDVAQAERILATTESTLPPIRIELARALNTIGVLLGRLPSDQHDELAQERPIPVPPPDVAVGVPANLVRQRPDIRSAERRLAMQTARVGIAASELYPQFALAGGLNVGNVVGDAAFDTTRPTYFLLPAVRWNLFNGGRVRARIKVREAKVEEALFTYENTLLNAIEEVESAIAAFAHERRRVEALEQAATVAREELTLGLDLYKQGLATFQSILDAQGAVFRVENLAATARGRASINLVALYRALGGGWDPDKVEPAQQPEPKAPAEKPAPTATALN
jgi:NodT family efflux transporter outer membrane factor (OMF) lipoprotein